MDVTSSRRHAYEADQYDLEVVRRFDDDVSDASEGIRIGDFQCACTLAGARI